MKPAPGPELPAGSGGSILARSGRRHWQRHPWQAVLAVTGIALGVAMVVAVDLASQSARASYLWSTETLAGKATHHILGLTGGLPDTLYARLRLAGLRDGKGIPPPMTPVLEDRITLAGNRTGSGDRTGSLRLVGIDPFSSRDLGALGLVESRADGPPSGGGLSELMASPGTVLLSRATAERLAIAPGDSLPISAAGRTVTVVVMGLLEPRNRLARTLVDDMLLCDLSTAQGVLARPGRLSRIEMDLSGSGTAARPEPGLPDRIAALLPPGARLAASNARARTLDSITRAFRINLAALSMLAMLVGAFLIYNTMSFSVAQRWSLFGTLRSLGAGPGEIARLVFREAAALSLAGAAAGTLGGILLGKGLVVLVSRTMNDLYFSAHVTGLGLDPLILAKGAALGIGMGLSASVGPAWQAARIRPRILLTRSAQETGLRRRLPLLGVLGAGMAAAAVLLAWLPGRSLIAGFAALACAVFAWALWAPGLLGAMSSAGAAMLAGVPGTAASLGRMAVRGAGSSLSRTGVAAAALMTALSVTVAMGVMVDSFRRTVSEWLGAVLIADVYVSAPRSGSGRPQGGLDSAWVRRARSVPGVAGSTTYLAVTLQSTDTGLVQLLALEMDDRSRNAFRFLEGGPETAWPAFQGPGCAVLISEPFAYRHRLHPGDGLSLPTRAGTRSFPVAGVFADYGSDQGVAMISRKCFEAHWEDRGITSLALFAEQGMEPDSLVRRLAALPGSGFAEGAPAVEFHPSRALREASLEIFDRTFAITSVLRLAAVIIALIGLMGALAALALERAPEIALLRALGLTPLQTWGLATAQAAFLGLATGVLSIPLGLAQAGLLIHVINRRSFGWTMPMQVDPWICAQALLLGLGAACFAAALPAWRISRADTTRALREE